MQQTRHEKKNETNTALRKATKTNKKMRATRHTDMETRDKNKSHTTILGPHLESPIRHNCTVTRLTRHDSPVRKSGGVSDGVPRPSAFSRGFLRVCRASPSQSLFPCDSIAVTHVVPGLLHCPDQEPQNIFSDGDAMFRFAVRVALSPDHQTDEYAIALCQEPT